MLEVERAISIEPGNLEATIVLASEQFSRGDVDGALQRLNAISAKDDPRVSLLKVQIFAKKGDLPQAEEALEGLDRHLPAAAFRSARLIQIYIAERRFDDAEKELRSVAAANPADSRAGLDVIRFLMSFRGTNAARDELTTKIKAGGEVFPYQMALVDLDYSQGNFTDSVDLLNSLIKAASSPEHTTSRQRSNWPRSTSA